jgi:exodeoxyribonuclease-3
MPTFASWNINSLRVRLPQVLALLAGPQTPDVLALQETKVEDKKFPVEPLADLGWQAVFVGEKAYNGVAFISREPLTDLDFGFDPQGQKRFLAASFGDWRLINIYAPNGQAVGSDKYLYKLNWYQSLTNYLQTALREFPKLCLLGDFNIAPTALDIYDADAWGEAILCSPAERQCFQALERIGLIDAFRQQLGEEKSFTWWDYRQAAFRRNLGARIDHILLSPAAQAEAQVHYQVWRDWRAQDTPSDHAPIACSIKEKS